MHLPIHYFLSYIKTVYIIQISNNLLNLFLIYISKTIIILYIIILMCLLCMQNLVVSCPKCRYWPKICLKATCIYIHKTTFMTQKITCYDCYLRVDSKLNQTSSVLSHSWGQIIWWSRVTQVYASSMASTWNKHRISYIVGLISSHS